MSNVVPTSHSISTLDDFLTMSEKAISQTIKSEPYTAEIRRNKPTAFIFMIDQSGSMNENIRGRNESKADFVARAINQTLQELISACTKSYGVGGYVDVAVIGYGGKNQTEAYSLWEGKLQGKTWVSTDEVYANPMRTVKKEVEINIKGKMKKRIEEKPVWIEPKSQSLTPMGAAIEYAYKLLQDWIARHPDNYPPAVFNFTDGAQTDCKDDELLERAKRLKKLHTSDGNIVFYNCHIDTSGNNTVLFPFEKSELPSDKYARLMYDISSDVPPKYLQDIAILRQNDIPTGKTATALVYQASPAATMKMIDIGTRTSVQQIKNTN
ncbi:MAG: VWA domain-containing protein [Bernardetiaceae bacterium]|nr:VWA domain-containing protein [Bernardetiaceae bacterium]